MSSPSIRPGDWWLVKAAEQGEPQAQFEAASVTGRARACPSIWSRRASGSSWWRPQDGFEKARGYLDEMAKEMTPEQIAKAEAAAKAFSQ